MDVCCAHCVYFSDSLFIKHNHRLLSQLAPMAPIAILEKKRVWKTRRRNPAGHKVPGGRGRPRRPPGKFAPVEIPPPGIARPLKFRLANASRTSTGPWSARLVTDHPSPHARSSDHQARVSEPPPGRSRMRQKRVHTRSGTMYTPFWHPKRMIYTRPKCPRSRIPPARIQSKPN